MHKTGPSMTGHSSHNSCHLILVVWPLIVTAILHTAHRMHGTESAIAMHVLQALVQTLTVSGGVAGLETLLKALYIFVLHVPLYVYG